MAGEDKLSMNESFDDAAVPPLGRRSRPSVLPGHDQEMPAAAASLLPRGSATAPGPPRLSD